MQGVTFPCKLAQPDGSFVELRSEMDYVVRSIRCRCSRVSLEDVGYGAAMACCASWQQWSGENKPRRRPEMAEMAVGTDTKCSRCKGCGKIADSDQGEPWTFWMELPLQSAAAVVMGLVKPIPCPACDGSGRKA